MSDPYIGEIRQVAFHFAPRGWAMCDGQLLSISQNEALFSILGTTYGGDGRTTFALPDLRGRVPIHFSNAHRLGTQEGSEGHTLTASEIPPHNHPLPVSASPGDVASPTNNAVMAQTARPSYGDPLTTTTLTTATNAQGRGQTHDNMQPFLTVNYVIALTGIYPSRS